MGEGWGIDDDTCLIARTVYQTDRIRHIKIYQINGTDLFTATNLHLNGKEIVTKTDISAYKLR